MTTRAVQCRVDSRKIKARMVSAKVRQILDMGYSSSLVRGIIAERLATTGDDYPTTESLLEAIFRLEEANPVASASGLATIPAISDDSSRISLIRSTSPLPTSGSLFSASSASSPRSSNPHNGQHHVDDSDSLPVISRPSAFASSSMSTFHSLAEQPSASAILSAPREETIADAQSKAKGKRKRNKKKAAGALDAETLEEDEQNLMSEASTGPQTDLENPAQLEELNLNKNQDKDAEMLSSLEEHIRLETTNPTASTSGLTASSAASDGTSKRKRSKKKKTMKKKEKKVIEAFNAATIDEDEQVAESVAGPQTVLGSLAQLEEMSLNENQNEETLQYVEENRRLREARSCKVCMDAELNTMFLPCGHLVCCNSCAPKLRNCPICRKFIKRTIKTFLP